MLALMCQVGGQRCAVDCAIVVEVIPRVKLESLPGTLFQIAGIARHRGESIPVVDLGHLLANQSCTDQWSNRIIVVERMNKGSVSRFGLMVEHIEPVHFPEGPTLAREAQGLGTWGQICQDALGVFQVLDLDIIHERAFVGNHPHSKTFPTHPSPSVLKPMGHRGADDR